MLLRNSIVWLTSQTSRPRPGASSRSIASTPPRPPETARAARALRASHRFALTGTPVENRLAELWSILDWTTPGLLAQKVVDVAKVLIPVRRRWVVERTFAWLTRWHRLARDYEARIDVSEAMNHVALGNILLRRISH